MQRILWLATLALLTAVFVRAARPAEKTKEPAPRTFEEHVRSCAVPTQVIDAFLDQKCWAKFDAEVGYTLGNSMPRDGIAGSSTISTARKDGARTNFLYRDRPCRINTYGDSFTQCHQVSDGETWQEYLAAHLGEPIRNFGMGGFGVYQAYRRMLREENTANAARYLILYMWGDDYFRSVLRSRYVLFSRGWKADFNLMFHGNFWSNIEMDLATGTLVEKDSLISEPNDLYKMTDPDFMWSALKDDLMLQVWLLMDEKVSGGVDEANLRRLAEILGVPAIDFGNGNTNEQKPEIKQAATRLRNAYGFAATKYILARAKAFAEANQKQILIVHFGPRDALPSLIKNGTRYDQQIVDYLRGNGFRYFDMNEVHVRDFQDFRVPFDEYKKRYFIGHYSPAGNHFFAHAIRPEIVSWLDPKPITYRDEKDQLIDFEGYIPD